MIINQGKATNIIKTGFWVLCYFEFVLS
jgi:hypothetical protein